MCTNLIITYDCGHQSKSNLPCGERSCKKTADHSRRSQYDCRPCVTELINRFRRERNEEKQKARDDGNVSAKMLQQRKAEREQDLKVATADICVHVDLETTFACGHQDLTTWSRATAKTAEAANHRSVWRKLENDRDENCGECLGQEEANRDEAFARLTRSHAAETDTVHESRERVDALEEERDELADSLDLVEDEVKAPLEELLSDGQRHTEEVDAQLDILAVEQAEFVRQMDDQNMALEIAILELREELQTALSENGAQNSRPVFDHHEADRFGV